MMIAIGLAIDLMARVVALIKCNITTWGDGSTTPFDGDEPATGPTRLNGDNLTFTDTEEYDFKGGDNFIEWYADAAVDNEFGDSFVWYDNTLGGSANIEIQIRAPLSNNNYLQAFSKDDNGLNQMNTGIIPIDVSGFKKIKYLHDSINDKNIILVDDVEVYNQTPLTATPVTINRRSVGARNLTSDQIKMDFYWLNDSICGLLNTVISLWGENDPDGNIIRDVCNNHWALSDGSQFGAVHPYKDAQGNPVTWPSFFRVNDRYQIGDTCVIVPAGEELEHTIYNDGSIGYRVLFVDQTGGKAPLLGDIIINGTKIGERIEGEFTPEIGFENWTMVLDNKTPSNTLLIVGDFAQFNISTGFWVFL